MSCDLLLRYERWRFGKALKEFNELVKNKEELKSITVIAVVGGDMDFVQWGKQKNRRTVRFSCALLQLRMQG